VGVVRVFSADSRAATALEYALIASMVAVAIAFAVTSFDIDVTKLGANFATVVSKI
jgi:Flp pilus assembly pilin Flp